ncbi:MAG: hypothetical protein PHC61_08905, partial [Chitinivibrionales bacterium]|nr:hypothetical protein [Chitinivibrionales bacterium]
GIAPEKINYKYFMFDTSKGSGTSHEIPAWIKKIRGRLIISGGLNHSNVKSIIENYCPFGVDVSSGVEKDKGIKDYKLMKKFIEEVNNAGN